MGWRAQRKFAEAVLQQRLVPPSLAPPSLPPSSVFLVMPYLPVITACGSLRTLSTTFQATTYISFVLLQAPMIHSYQRHRHCGMLRLQYCWSHFCQAPVCKQVRATFVERFSMGAPFSAGEVQGPAFRDVSQKVDWVEKFVRVGTAATEAARSQEDE